MRTRAYSPRTESAYVGWIQRFLDYHGGKNPATLGRLQVEEYLHHLSERGMAPATRNLAASAISFMYRELWGLELGGRSGLDRPRSRKHLPRNAPPEDVAAVLEGVRGEARLACLIMYGSGTRVSETLSVRIQDVDLGRRELTLRAAKGSRDRTTLIATRAVEPLRRQIQRVREIHESEIAEGGGWAPLPYLFHLRDPLAGWNFGWQFLFPSRAPRPDPATGHLGRHSLHPSSVQRKVRKAAHAAGLERPFTCHTFRHSFATELVRKGVEVRLIQRLLGHRWLNLPACGGSARHQRGEPVGPAAAFGGRGLE